VGPPATDSELALYVDRRLRNNRKAPFTRYNLYIVDSTNVPLKYFTVAFTPRVMLN